MTYQTNSNSFYVYEHVRPDTGAVFYVGKGTKSRSRQLFGRNDHHKNIVSKLKNLGLTFSVDIIADNLPEDSAFTLETMRIAMWRAAKVPLTNFTDGGEGLRNPSEATRRKIGKISSQRLKDNTILRAALDRTGRPHSEDTRRKISQGGKDAVARDPSIREKVAEASKRHYPAVKDKLLAAAHTPEARKKMSLKLKGRVVSDETRAKLSAAGKGRAVSDEARAKISVTLKGRKQSEEIRAKISAGLQGKKKSPKAIEKTASAHRGMKRSEEAKQRMRDAHARRKLTESVIRDERGRIVGFEKKGVVDVGE